MASRLKTIAFVKTLGSLFFQVEDAKIHNKQRFHFELIFLLLYAVLDTDIKTQEIMLPELSVKVLTLHTTSKITQNNLSFRLVKLR